MDALLATFVAAALAEFGDKTQLLVMAFAVRYGRAGPVLAGVAVAAMAGSLAAAFAGTLLHELVTSRATALLVVVALAFAGVGGLIGSRKPEIGARWKTGAFLTTAACVLLLEMGDKTQLLTVALAAHFNSLFLAGAGAAMGIVAANIPAALAADRLQSVGYLRHARIGIGFLFLIAGFIVAINALELI